MSTDRKGEAKTSSTPLGSALDFNFIVSKMCHLIFSYKQHALYDVFRRVLLLVLDPTKDNDYNEDIADKVAFIFNTRLTDIPIKIENLLVNHPKYRQQILSAISKLATFSKTLEQCTSTQLNIDSILSPLVNEVYEQIAASPQYAESIAEGFILLCDFDRGFNPLPYKQFMQLERLKSIRIAFYPKNYLPSGFLLKDRENKALLVRHPQYAEKIAEGLIYLYPFPELLKDSLLDEYRQLMGRYPQYAEDIGYAVRELRWAKLENKALLINYPQFARGIADVLRQLGALALSDAQQKLHQHIQYAGILAQGLQDLHKQNLLNKENVDRLFLCASHKHIILCLPVLRMAGYLNQQNFEALVRYREFGEEIFRALMDVHTFYPQTFDRIIRRTQDREQAFARAVTPLLITPLRAREVAVLAQDFFPQINRKVDVKEEAAPVLRVADAEINSAQSNILCDPDLIIVEAMRDLEERAGLLSDIHFKLLLSPDRIRRLLPLVLDPKQDRDKNLSVARMLEFAGYFSEQDRARIEELIRMNPMHRLEILEAVKELCCMGKDFLADNSDGLKYFLNALWDAIAANPQYAVGLAKGFSHLYRNDQCDGQADVVIPVVAILPENKALLEKHPQYAEQLAQAIVRLHKADFSLNIFSAAKELLEKYPQYASNIVEAHYLANDPNFSPYVDLVFNHLQFAKEIIWVLRSLDKLGILNSDVARCLRQNIQYAPNIMNALKNVALFSLRENINKLFLCAPYKDVIACLALLQLANPPGKKNLNVFDVLIEYREFGDETLRGLMGVHTLNQQTFDDVITRLQAKVQARDAVVTPLLIQHAQLTQKVAAIMFDFLPKINRQEADAKVVPVLPAADPKR